MDSYMILPWTFRVEFPKEAYTQVVGEIASEPRKRYQLSIAFLRGPAIDEARLTTLIKLMKFYYQITERESLALIEWLKIQLSA